MGMRQEVYAWISGMLQIIGTLAIFIGPFLALHTIYRIFRWIISRARGEKFEDLRDDSLDTYDRARANYYARGDRASRDRYYAEMRGGRGHRGRQTRY
jgi:hypothetical protein